MASAEGKVLILWAAMSADASVGDKTEKVKFWLGTAAKKQFELIDGSDAALKDTRNKLFEISGKRAVYPQVFVQKGDDITFVGDFDGVEALVESNEELKGLDAALEGVADASE